MSTAKAQQNDLLQATGVNDQTIRNGLHEGSLSIIHYSFRGILRHGYKDKGEVHTTNTIFELLQ